MNITVLMGGTSSERDVSLSSGLRIAEALRERGHEVAAFDPALGAISEAEEAAMRSAGVVGTVPPTPEALRELERTSCAPSLGTFPEIRNADVVFLALHGGQGEDGTIQALLDMVGVRYTGSGHLASALAMDKDLSKRLFRAAGVPTADWLMTGPGVRLADGVRLAAGVRLTGAVSLTPPAAEVERALGWPVIVKPSKQGSTVGLTLVRDPEALEAAIEEAARHDDEVMIEQYIPGRELTVTVVGDRALPVGEIFPAHEIYDYECKYTAGMAHEKFPADLTDACAAEAQRFALAAFRALKLGGCARIDFRMTERGELYCLEANTLPGMTPLSLAPQAAVAAGMSFAELCDRIVQLAV
ncbi:MAG TPA: D-alanine--D-alanine ligase [Gemmatimonadaceae bacterium]|nr:D-alanine--D-alanine ligase [Gemmatimonadaceae bacterium]